MIAKTPPPYYAVIFSSIRTVGDKGYTEVADKMIELAKEQDGFLGVESARNDLGITVSYWKNLDSIQNWQANAQHKLAKQKGRDIWYQSYKLRISKVETDYNFIA
jgi:heme-degrading monooxygenase HmoA